ncbi:MAG: MarR family transcriptional regulator [Caedibacter sp. 38-128]|nr:MarR family transcriptional regulator [Holosporales bacterium]OJX04743.1 MAG: MarR family transcriptional regulator [Caedibacter sp. 38-128]
MSYTKISHLEDHIGYWLRCVSNHVSHAFARKLADQEVTVAEWALMRMLYGQSPLAPSRVAKQMGMTKGAITKLVDRLIAKSFIVRASNADDGRAQTISLTKEGEKLVPVLAQLADSNDQEYFNHLSSKDQETLQRILRHLTTKFGVTSVAIE